MILSQYLIYIIDIKFTYRLIFSMIFTNYSFIALMLKKYRKWFESINIHIKLTYLKSLMLS